MARTLGGSFTTEKNLVWARPFNSMVVHFGGAVGDIYISDRDVTISSNAHKGIVSAWGRYRTVVAPRDGAFQVVAMDLALINLPVFAGSLLKRFSDLFGAVGLEGIEVDIYQNFTQVGGSTIYQELLFPGVIRLVSHSPALCKLTSISVSEKYLDQKQISFVLANAELPDADPEEIGRRANIVYGSVKKARAHAGVVGLRSTVRAAIAAAVTAIPIHDDFYDALPSTGSVIIGNETKAYSAKAGSAGARTLTVTATADAHNKDDTIIQVVSSWVFIAAGHAMKAIDIVYVKRGDKLIPLAAAQYTVNLSNTALIAGRTLTTITFTAPPLIAEKDQVKLGSSEASWHQVGSSETPTVSSFSDGLTNGQFGPTTALSFPAQEKTVSSGSVTRVVTANVVSTTRAGMEIWLVNTGGAAIAMLCSGAAGSNGSVVSVSGNFWSLSIGLKNVGATFSTLQSSVVNVSIKTADYAIAGATLSSTSTADNPIGEVYFDGQGYADNPAGFYTGTADALIEKPADVIHHLARVVGEIPPSRIDSAAFVTARTDSPSSYVFAGVIGERPALKTLLLAMGMQARIQVDWPVDKITGRFLKSAYPATGKALTQENIVADSLSVARSELADLVNTINLHYGRDWSNSRNSAAYSANVFRQDQVSVDAYGAREQTDRFLCDFIGSANATMAGDLADFWLSRLKSPARLLSFQAKLDQYELLPGDIFTLDFKTKLTATVERYDGLNGAQGFLVESVDIAPGSARDRRATRMAITAREVSGNHIATAAGRATVTGIKA